MLLTVENGRHTLVARHESTEPTAADYTTTVSEVPSMASIDIVRDQMPGMTSLTGGAHSSLLAAVRKASQSSRNN